MMPLDMLWRCSWCGAHYTTEEYIALPSVQAVEDEPDPRAPTGHGFIPVCTCGKRFHDKWRLQEFIEVGNVSYWLSTVALELALSGMWYESMLFPVKPVPQRVVDALTGDEEGISFSELHGDRYRTQAEAEEGHRVIKEKVLHGELPRQQEDVG